MKAKDFLAAASQKLNQAGIGSARLDTLILLEDCLHRDRSYILAHLDIQLSDLQLKKLNRQIERRATHIPLAYIRGFCEFYGRKFKVNKHVLEPRPESETMIELLKQLVEGMGSKVEGQMSIADVGTGSGALGITAALEIPGSHVDLFDIDASALAVAKHNCELHELHLKAYKRDLLARVHRPYDVILANLPYVPSNWHVNQAAALEPRLAIDGGQDGLDVYRRLFEQLKKFSWQPKFILTEALPPQHEKLAQVANEHGFNLYKTEDLIQIFSDQK
jgi:release factor glutamine methyltransferase